MKRVLVTGIDGFTGVYLAEVLVQAGWQVWGIGQATTSCVTANYRCVDMLDRLALRQAIKDIAPNAVIHLAGVSAPTHGNVDWLYRVNITACRYLLEALAAAELSLDAVVLASSAYVYGSVTEGVMSETSPLNPGNDYAVSKLAMEHMAKLWLPKLPIVVARPFNYTGIGQTEAFLLPKIVAHFKRAEPVIELGNTDISRDFSDVRAVAQAYSRLLTARPVGEVVNICSGKAISIAEILAMAEQITGHHITVKTNPAFVRTNDVQSLWGDPTKLRALIGAWEPIALFDTLTWMLDGSSHEL